MTITTTNIRSDAMLHDKGSNSFTKTEAESFIGKTVNTNAGTALITGIFCNGPDEYQAVDSDGFMYSKCDKNGLYII
jgi:hypothetical protein